MMKNWVLNYSEMMLVITSSSFSSNDVQQSPLTTSRKVDSRVKYNPDNLLNNSRHFVINIKIGYVYEVNLMN